MKTRRTSHGNIDTSTNAEIAERIAHRKAGEIAIREREERFPALTTETGLEALQFQTERQTFHRNRILREEGIPALVRQADRMR